jgi:REP element-mobilizing transposase RayT
MAQSLTKILVHLVFSTKKRNAWIDDEISSELYAYMFKILENHNCNVLRIGGTENHIHILCVMAKNLSIGKVVEEIKTSSSKWIKTKDQKYKKFYWQHGYGAFSISSSHIEPVCDYIANQKQHHKIVTFEEEFRNLLRKYNLKPDEKYPLD